MMLLSLVALLMAASPTQAKSAPARDAAAAAAAGEAAAAAAAEAATDEESRGAVYDPARDADADVAAAFTRAQGNGRMVMIVLGGNWCHDSRALASHFGSPDFADMLNTRYEVVYVDVGHRDRNLSIPARYGIAAVQGTPTVMILSPQGELLNRGTAGSWRNAASRRRATIYSAFATFGAR